jgi:peptidoglycan/LPS O-acetylase OafA/YrhL
MMRRIRFAVVVFIVLSGFSLALSPARHGWPLNAVSRFAHHSPPDLAALFALGVLTAGIVGAGAARQAWPWPWFSLAAAAPVCATILVQGSVWTLDHLFWADLALGPAIACLLAGLATGRPTPLVRLLDARPLRSLGSSSYSLYLTQGPIVVLIYEEIVAGPIRQGVLAFLGTLALALPLTIVFARVFASVFETPFRHRHRRSSSIRRRPGKGVPG